MSDYYLDPCCHCGTFCEYDPRGCPAKRQAETVTEADQKEYDEYFTACEKANKIPLCFDKWKEKRSAENL